MDGRKLGKRTKSSEKGRKGRKVLNRTLISILGSCACPKADLELKNQDPIPYFPLLFSELEVFWLNLASLVLDFFILTIPVPSQESLLPPALLVYALRLAPASYGPQEDAALYGSNK